MDTSSCFKYILRFSPAALAPKLGASPGLGGLVAQDVYVPPTFELGHDDVQRARPAHYVSPGLKMVVLLQHVRVHIYKMHVFFKALKVKVKKACHAPPKNGWISYEQFANQNLKGFFALGKTDHEKLRGDFVRPKQRRQIQRDRSKRHEEREVEEPEPKEKTVPKAKAAKARRCSVFFWGGGLIY